jgi:hypothetical protein
MRFRHPADQLFDHARLRRLGCGRTAVETAATGARPGPVRQRGVAMRITERRARLLVDTAMTYAQRGTMISRPTLLVGTFTEVWI